MGAGRALLGGLGYLWLAAWEAVADGAFGFHRCRLGVVRADSAVQVRSITRVALAEDLGVGLDVRVAVDPLVGVGVPLIRDVTVGRVERWPRRPQEEVEIARLRRIHRVLDQDLLTREEVAVPRIRFDTGGTAGGALLSGVAPHEHDLVVVGMHVQRRDLARFVAIHARDQILR